MRISVSFTGQEEIARRLNAIPQKLRRPILIRALELGGLPILRLMEQYAPFDPESGGPHLKSSMVMVPLRSLDGVGMGEHEAAIALGPARHVRHGGFQELGTGEHPPQPYMRPAWDAEGGDKAQRRIAAELWIAIQGAAR